jgi:hypothetical protein
MCASPLVAAAQLISFMRHGGVCGNGALQLRWCVQVAYQRIGSSSSPARVDALPRPSADTCSRLCVSYIDCRVSAMHQSNSDGQGTMDSKDSHLQVARANVDTLKWQCPDVPTLAHESRAATIRDGYISFPI